MFQPYTAIKIQMNVLNSASELSWLNGQISPSANIYISKNA